MLGSILGYWWLVLLILLVGGLIFLFRRKTDIEWNTLDAKLAWDSGSSEDSLAKVYDYVLSFSEGTIQWYKAHRQPKRRLGVFLRTGALLLTAAAGVVPLTKELKIGEIPAVWGTIMLGVAGVAVSVDLLLGFTSGWVRYMLAQQKVERLKDAFLIEWNTLKVANTDTKSMLDRARAFLLAVGKVIDDETQEWATEFQNALKEMEKARKEAEEIQRTGALEVSVKNPQAVAEWTLEVDGSDRGRTSGGRIAVTDVRVGIRKLKAFGTDPHGKRLTDESTVKVEGGATVAAELELG